LKGIMQAKRKPIAAPGPDELGLAAGEIGAAGSRLEILSVGFPDSGGGAQMLEGDAETAARALVEKLQKEVRVL
ncbi:MAG TPA: electron transfer flavoprotein beta subunit/FixA family protein, partial [Thermoanaerobaculia bacterium]|nr:electron transfer flavoprotein beta subunit/FixA family protein [Thermoanaerobaculia bacterium]